MKLPLVVKGKVVPVLNSLSTTPRRRVRKWKYRSTLRHEDVWGSGSIGPHFLDLGARWRWVVSFRPQRFSPRVKSSWYLLHRRLGGAHNRSGRLGDENILDPTGAGTPAPSAVQPVTSRYTDCAIPTPFVNLRIVSSVIIFRVVISLLPNRSCLVWNSYPASKVVNLWCSIRLQLVVKFPQSVRRGELLHTLTSWKRGD
jgi:hypothetical protein